MKNILFYLILLPLWANSQTEKGATPLPQSSIVNPKSSITRAVVIGISDYQDEQIPDLRFADRDAEAFAAWLRSPAGGALQEEHIQLLTNRDATTGKMIAALDWLIVASKPGDEAIIYFSGHGDVERVTKFQRGYWLTYDSPPAVYAAGAFSLQFLQDIVTTLAEAEVQAVVVSDACRAGKLAGSEYGGAQATAAALSKQFANEIKILSCQPDEFSLEGEQWGGGRGCFSFHLVDALYGMADTNADGTVNLLELGRYLEDRVPAETAPHPQIPMTVGSKTTRIATVNAGVLAEWRQRRKDDPSGFSKIDARGLEDLALAKADTAILEMYRAFTAALDAGKLMATDSTVGKSADDYYKLLIQEPSIADLHGLMTRNFAAALMDEGQQVINRFLKTDPNTISNVWANPIQFDHISDQLHRAADLLGERHYVYRILKAKEFYFLEKRTRKENYPVLALDSIIKIKRNLLEQGLLFDSTAAYLWESYYAHPIGNSKIDNEKSIYQAEKAIELSPGWALAHFELGNLLSVSQPEKSIFHFKKSMELAPDFMGSYNWIGWPLETIGQLEEAQRYRSLFVQIIMERRAADSSSVSILDLKDMGNALWRLRRFEEAEVVQREVIAITKGKYRSVFGNFMVTLADRGKFEEMVDTYEVCCTETHGWDLMMGELCLLYLNDTLRAEYYFKKVLGKIFEDTETEAMEKITIAIHHKKLGNYEKASSLLLPVREEALYFQFELGDLQRLCGRKEDAAKYYETIVREAEPVFRKTDIGPFYYGSPEFVYKAIALQRLGKENEMQNIIEQALSAPDADAWRHFWIACIFAQTNQPEKAIKHLQIAESMKWLPNPTNWIFGTVKDYLLDPLRPLPAFQAWEQRWLPPYKDYSKE